MSARFTVEGDGPSDWEAEQYKLGPNLLPLSQARPLKSEQISSPSPRPQLPGDPDHGEPPAGLLPHLALHPHLVRPRSTPLLSVRRRPRPPRLGFRSRADSSATSRSDSALAG